MTETRQKPIEPLTEQEIASLIRAARPESLSGARARALISLLAYGGLRIGEALALRPHDVDLEGGTVSVLRGKGGKQRVAALLAEGIPHVERWMRKRRPVTSTGPLLCTVKRGANVNGGTMRPGQPLGRDYAQHLLRRLASRAGIDRRVHPHGLRHSHAHLLALRGKLPTDIMQQLGHANLATTSGYLNSFAPASRVDRLREEPATWKAARWKRGGEGLPATRKWTAEELAAMIEALHAQQAALLEEARA